MHQPAGARHRAALRLGQQADCRALPRTPDLAAAGVLRGRRATAYPACAPDVEIAGATFVSIPIDGAVTDGNLVTGPAWPAHQQWLAQFLAVLGTRVEHAAPAIV